MVLSGGVADGKRIADPVMRAGVLRVTLDDPSGESRLSLKRIRGLPHP
jgi:hypothetical protein